MAVITVLALLLSLVATILAFIFIVPEKKRVRLNKFGKLIHDTVNFKYLIVEKILQALYIFLTSGSILIGFFMLFYVQPGYDNYYYTTSSTWYGGYGILIMIVGPIVIRLVYEFLMMALLLVKNVIQINNKIKCDGKEEKDEEKVDIFNVPEIEKDEKPKVSFCSKCGTKAEGGAFCSNCGAEL